MNVWLMHIGEDLPMDGGERKFRYGYVADAVLRRGGTVLRWAPTLRHIDKQQRADRDKLVNVSPGYRVQLVHALGYRSHIGVRRLRMYQTLRKRFYSLASGHVRPDVIVAAIPSLEWAEAATLYGKQHGVPVVVDVRDLWPDVFEAAAPAPMRWLAHRMLARYRRMAERACTAADALTGVSPSYLDWALQHAGRPQGRTDAVTPIGYHKPVATASARKHLENDLRRRGFDARLPTACYVGQFAWSSDVSTAIDAARRLHKQGRTLQLLLCGEGSGRKALERKAEGLPGVHFLGWVGADIIAAVMEQSQVGLCAYAPQALQSWPNKPFEYMAGRLAVVSSLKGDLQRLLLQHDAGVTYHPGDTESLAGVLTGLLNSAAGLDQKRDNAHRLWRERFRPEEVYDRFVDQLASLVETPLSAAA